MQTLNIGNDFLRSMDTYIHSYNDGLGNQNIITRSVLKRAIEQYFESSKRRKINNEPHLNEIDDKFYNRFEPLVNYFKKRYLEDNQNIKNKSQKINHDKQKYCNNDELIKLSSEKIGKFCVIKFRERRRNLEIKFMKSKVLNGKSLYDWYNDKGKIDSVPLDKLSVILENDYLTFKEFFTSNGINMYRHPFGGYAIPEMPALEYCGPVIFDMLIIGNRYNPQRLKLGKTWNYQLGKMMKGYSSLTLIPSRRPYIESTKYNDNEKIYKHKGYLNLSYLEFFDEIIKPHCLRMIEIRKIR
jgi:hypothetical protein